MDVTAFLKSLGLKANDKTNEIEAIVDKHGSSDEPTAEGNEVKALKAEIAKLKEELNARSEDKPATVTADADEIAKLREEVRQLQTANRDLILGSVAEPEKSLEENLMDLYKLSRGGTLDGAVSNS